MLPNETSAEFLARMEAEEAAAFAEAVAEWRAERKAGRGQATVLEAGGDFGSVREAARARAQLVAAGDGPFPLDAPFVKWSQDASFMEVPEADHARPWYPRGRYMLDGRPVLVIKCELDPFRDGQAEVSWREQWPSTGRWRAFFLEGTPDAVDLSLAEAKELVELLGFKKWTMRIQDRASFAGGWHAYWPPESPHTTTGGSWNSG